VKKKKISSIFYQKHQNQKVKQRIDKIHLNIDLIYQVMYTITTVTSSEDDSGTDSGVFMTIFGENDRTKQFQLTKQNSDSLFQQGGTDQFEIELDDVGDVCSLKLLVIL
jgi:hypothetical protein